MTDASGEVSDKEAIKELKIGLCLVLGLITGAYTERLYIGLTIGILAAIIWSKFPRTKKPKKE